MARSGRKKRKPLVDEVQRAVLLLKASKLGNGKGMTARQAMEFAGINTVNCNDKVYQKQVTRRANEKEQEGGRALASTFEAVLTISNSVTPAPIPVNKTKLVRVRKRQNTSQKHAEWQYNAEKNKIKDKLFKHACELWKAESNKKAAAKQGGYKYKAKSPEAICSEINASNEAVENGIRIIARTVRTYVEDGRAGLSMQKPGPKGVLADTE
jgi:hypothetical protein